MSVGAGPVAILCGPPGSGKTSTGRALAALLGVAFHDTDAAIEAGAGKPISDIFVDDGESAFRALERVEVERAVREQAGVVALGGGAVLDPGTEALLRERPVVFLDVGIADAARRIGLDRSRPLLAVNPRASWIAMMRTRRATYERVGRWRVETDGRTPEQVAGEVAALLAADRAGAP